MNNLKVCRICLKNEGKLYKCDKSNLITYYQDLVMKSISSSNELPEYFCYECAATLIKFHKFRRKCLYTYDTLSAMILDGQTTEADVSNLINRKDHRLKYGQLAIIKTNKRVATYIMEHDYMKKNSSVVLDQPANEVHLSSESDEEMLGDKDLEPIKEVVLDIDDNIVETVYVSDSNDNISNSADTIVENIKEKKSKSRKSKKVGKINTRKRNKCVSDSEDDDCEVDNDEEFTIKRPNNTDNDRKNVEFTKAKGGKPKVLKFLDSGFWKKSFLSDDEALIEFHAKAQDRKYIRAAYKCTDCYRGFSQKSMLDRHIPLKHGEDLGPLICRFCKCRFRTAYFLNKHMRLHYTRFECLRCNLVCNIDKSALFHEEYHNGVIRKCPHCDKEFRHMSTFYTHLRTHRSKHMCTTCGESFVSELGLYLHRKVKHITTPDTLEEESTYCEVCKIKFETAVAYNRHLLHSAMHTEEKMLDDDVAMKDMENDVFEDKEANETQNSEELYTRKSRVEKTLSAVRKRNLHKGEPKISKKPTTCQHCGKHFESQTACMKHHHAEHPRKPFYTPQDRVICEVCGVSLAPSSVPAHINQHTRRKMYTCDTCGRSFTTNNILRNHIVSGSLSLHHKTVHLKQPYPKRNRRKKIEPNTEAGPFGDKEEYRVWRHYQVPATECI
ncbi:hypothetical protein ACJJTC_000782 [Scirpophaga incertulas]